jgi:predicted naringenin-chalcone synthase
MSKIIAIGTASPAYRYKQETILDFMLSKHQLSVEEQKSLRNLYDKSGIDYRYSAIPDFNLQANSESELFGKETPDISARLNTYYKYALPLALKAVEDCLKNVSDKTITHLISVSCTGMMAPGLDIELIKALQLPPTTERTAVQFIGCYAAMHALKQAHYICQTNKNANILIVCVELCTLHFQSSNSRDNLLSNAIFSDGAAAALISNTHSTEKTAIALHHFCSHLDFSGFDDMGWYILSTAFQMRLTSHIPAHIKTQFKQFIEKELSSEVLSEFPKDPLQYDWAIHPGGKKILDVIEDDFKLPEQSLTASRGVLKQYGNMSSVTILFILKSMLQNGEKNKPLFISAFGPGLTTETAFARYV